LKYWEIGYDITIYSHVLIPNHVHLLVETNETPLFQVHEGTPDYLHHAGKLDREKEKKVARLLRD
jgi:hypothetical protein